MKVFEMILHLLNFSPSWNKLRIEQAYKQAAYLDKVQLVEVI